MAKKGALTQQAEKIEHQGQCTFDHGSCIVHGDLAIHTLQESRRFPSPDKIGGLAVEAQNVRGVIEVLVEPRPPHVAPDANQLRAGDAQSIALLRLYYVNYADTGERACVVRSVWPAVQQRREHHRRSAVANAVRNQLLQLVEGARLHSPFRSLAADDCLDLRQSKPILALKSPHGQDGLNMLLAIVGDRLARSRGFGNQSFAQIDADSLPMYSGQIFEFTHFHAGRYSMSGRTEQASMIPPSLKDRHPPSGSNRSTFLRFLHGAQQSAAGLIGPILVLQDTTEFTYQRRNSHAVGFTKSVNSGRDKAGRLRPHPVYGIQMHSSLVVTEESLPLGLAAVKFWNRDKFKGTAQLKRKINPTRVPIEAKERVC